MTGFVDVLLRGILLVGAAVALGGVFFVRVVLRAGPGIKPDEPARRALRLTALGAGVVAVAQGAVGALTLGTLVVDLGGAALAPFTQTPFAMASGVRVAFALATVALAVVLARHPAGPITWAALTTASGLVVAS